MTQNPITRKVKVHFSDYFNVPQRVINDYGAFNISLINDLPLFIDPFLLFSSEKTEYQILHNKIIEYISFLRDISQSEGISDSLLRSWFCFPEVKENWFGYSETGNGGSGLGIKFARSLNRNLNTIFNNFGTEQVTEGSHLEKLSLIDKGVGRDNISDFTTNLIHKYLLEYTEKFTKEHVSEEDRKAFQVKHVEFDYKTRRWVSGLYTLPKIGDEHVILTPRDILTRDETWINHTDLIVNFEEVVDTIPNEQLRSHISEYFLRELSKIKTKKDKPKKEDVEETILQAIKNSPEIIDYFIKFKEDNKEDAKDKSTTKVSETESKFVEAIQRLVYKLLEQSEFYETDWDTFEEAYQRIIFLKNVIEKNDGYRYFYINSKPIKREKDLQIMYRLTWFAPVSDVNSEVNNGRGPVDYKISKGSRDKTLIEFKLASNSQIRRNLEKQVEIYEEANDTKKSIKVILYFSEKEKNKVLKIINDLKLKQGKQLVLIDGRADNKPSASAA